MATLKSRVLFSLVLLICILEAKSRDASRITNQRVEIDKYGQLTQNEHFRNRFIIRQNEIPNQQIGDAIQAIGISVDENSNRVELAERYFSQYPSLQAQLKSDQKVQQQIEARISHLVNSDDENRNDQEDLQLLHRYLEELNNHLLRRIAKFRHWRFIEKQRTTTIMPLIRQQRSYPNTPIQYVNKPNPFVQVQYAGGPNLSPPIIRQQLARPGSSRSG